MIQLQVLNKILQDKDSSLILLNNLTDRYFSEYKDEFNFIINHYTKYGVIPDIGTFLNTFPNFENIKVEDSSEYLIEELFKDYRTRVLATTFNNVRQLLLDGRTDDAIEVYKKSTDNLVDGTALRCVDITKDTSRYKDYVERTEDFNKYYISTGIPELDAIIGGWDREEELATIIARTNVGKSWLLIKFAEAAVKQGLHVGLYSGEMSEKKVGYRFDTLAGNISNGSLTHGNIDIMNAYTEYIKELPNKYKGSLKVLTPNMISGPAGVNALRAFVEKEKLDILLVDQYSLLEDDRNAKNPVEKVSNISNDLKNLQVMKRIPIIAVSQMNRSKNDDGSDVIDSMQIALSDRIGQNSTLIIGLSRDKKDKSLLKLQIVKSRDTNAGQILSYIVDFNNGMMIYVPEEPKEESGENGLKERYRATNVPNKQPLPTQQAPDSTESNPFE